MFEPQFLGQVPVRQLGQSSPATAAGAPSPASSDSRFAVPAGENFVPPLSPFMVPFMQGYDYPPQYPRERFDCTLNSDGLSWTCTPKVSAPPVVMVGPPYPVAVGPFGPFVY